MNHPHASRSNIFNFLWCIWKSRNDCLFARKYSYPHQVHLVAAAMAHFNITQQISLDNCNDNNQSHNTGNNNVTPHQCCTLMSDLLIAGAKIYSHTSFKCSKIPGLSNGNTATGIGVYLNFMQDQRSIQIQIQASAQTTSQGRSTSPSACSQSGITLAGRPANVSYGQPDELHCEQFRWSLWRYETSTTEDCLWTCSNPQELFWSSKEWNQPQHF